MRDLEGIAGTGLPVWAQGVAAPPAVAGLTFVGWGEPVGCGGIAVYPEELKAAATAQAERTVATRARTGAGNPVTGWRGPCSGTRHEVPVNLTEGLAAPETHVC